MTNPPSFEGGFLLAEVGVPQWPCAADLQRERGNAWCRNDGNRSRWIRWPWAGLGN